MPVFRVEKKSDYTCLANSVIRDKNLSLKAIGLLTLMLSLPPDWDYTLCGLVQICKDGKSSVSAALDELEKYGYLVRKRERDDKGRLAGVVYTVYEIPQIDEKTKSDKPKFENPTLDNPAQAFPTLEKPMLEKRLQQSIDIQNKEKQITDEQSNAYLLTTREKTSSDGRQDLFTRIRNVLGRALHPCERAMCSLWVEQHIDPDVICMAVEDNLFRKERFDMKYVKATLNQWSKAGVRTARDARNYILDHHAEHVSQMASEIAEQQGNEHIRDRIIYGNATTELQGTRDYMIELYKHKRYDSLLAIAANTHMKEVFDYLPEEIMSFIKRNGSVA